MFYSYDDIFKNPFSPHPDVYENPYYIPVFIVQVEKVTTKPDSFIETITPTTEILPDKDGADEKVVETESKNQNLPVKSDVQYHVDDIEKKKPFWRK